MSLVSAVPLRKRLRWPGREPLPVESGPSPAVLARTFLYLYFAGGTIAIGTNALPHSSVRSDLGIVGPGVAALGVALVMLVCFERLPLWVFRSLPPLGTVLASIVVWSAAPSLMVPYAGFYFWVALSSFYLFAWGWAAINVAFVAVAFAAVLILTPSRADRLTIWLITVGTVAVGGTMIGLLRARLEWLLEELGAALGRTSDSERALAEAQRIAAIGSWELDLRTRLVSGSAQFRRTFALESEEPVDVEWVATRVHRTDRGRIIRAFRRARDEAAAIETVVRALLPDGSTRYIDVRGQVVRAGGAPVKIVGTAQDITERTAQQQRLHRTLRRLSATTDIALALGSETQLEGLLRLIAQRTRLMLEARGVAIFVVRDGRLRRAATAGDAGRAADQVERDADIAQLGGVGVQHVADSLTVPLEFRGEVHGLLVVTGPDGIGFGTDDEDMLRAFATSAATAVAAAKSVQRDSLRRSIEASERERRRWARELHDQTLQGLGVLQMRLQMALGAGPEALEQTAHAALGQISSEVANLRRIIADLRPAVLDDFGLEPALEMLAQRIAETGGTEVATAIDLSRAGRRLSAELEQTIYRLVQEALANVSKHAGPCSARVEVRFEGDAVLVIVADDGYGFDIGALSEGFGLSGMRERVRLANGRLTVESGLRGTRVEAVLPLERAEAMAPAPS
jgi:PAS domain S-box-containing protein